VLLLVGEIALNGPIGVHEPGLKQTAAVVVMFDTAPVAGITGGIPTIKVAPVQ